MILSFCTVSARLLTLWFDSKKEDGHVPLIDVDEAAQQFLVNVRLGVYPRDKMPNFLAKPLNDKEDSKAFRKFLKSSVAKKLMASS